RVVTEIVENGVAHPEMWIKPARQTGDDQSVIAVVREMFREPFGEADRAHPRLQNRDTTPAEQSAADFHARLFRKGFSREQIGGDFEFDIDGGADAEIGKAGSAWLTQRVERPRCSTHSSKRPPITA